MTTEERKRELVVRLINEVDDDVNRVEALVELMSGTMLDELEAKGKEIERLEAELKRLRAAAGQALSVLGSLAGAVYLNTTATAAVYNLNRALREPLPPDEAQPTPVSAPSKGSEPSVQSAP